jgi:hypothetical protein
MILLPFFKEWSDPAFSFSNNTVRRRAIAGAQTYLKNFIRKPETFLKRQGIIGKGETNQP